MKKNLINCNPVENSIYFWNNVKIDFGKDFSKIVIEQDGKKIYVNGSFFTDVKTVMNNVVEENTDLLINIVGTTLASPNMDDF